jgi:hypothetical protein
MNGRVELVLHEREEQRNPRPVKEGMTSRPWPAQDRDIAIDPDNVHHDFVIIYPDKAPESSRRCVEELQDLAGPDVQIAAKTDFFGHPAPSGLAGGFVQDLTFTFGSVGAMLSLLRASKDILSQWLQYRESREVKVTFGGFKGEAKGSRSREELEALIAQLERIPASKEGSKRSAKKRTASPNEMGQAAKERRK